MFARPRRGISLLELVVVLFVIALLFALFVPWVSRQPSRRLHCLNNMRQVGLAMQGYATMHEGKLPALEADGHSWPRHLLRMLDQPALDRKIAAEGWSPEKAPYLPTFVCPSDDDSYYQPGGLSYVVNAGYGFFPVDPKSGAVSETGTHSLSQDWDGDGEVSEQDRLITQATGVIWRREDYVRSWTLERIANADGISNTLLLAENLTAGPWTSRDTRSISFVIGRERLTFDSGKGPLALQATDLGLFAINGAEDANGPVPTPSSNHDDYVNVIWVEGRGTSVSETIDPLVYARLLTPAGQSYGEQTIDERESY